LLVPNTTLFISDIHLSDANPALQELFLDFLQGPALFAERIFILGDLFDAWVGKDVNKDFQEFIKGALKNLSEKGIKLFFMAGNRDFLIQHSFLKEAGIKRISDPTIIQLHGIPTLLTHGDRLCTQDIAYQRYRRIAQNPFTRFLFLSLPRRMRQNIGQKLRQKSRQYQQTQDIQILDVSLDAVETCMKRYKVPQLIHGHVHRPNIHDVKLEGAKGKRLVMGDWHTEASLLISTPTETSLATYTPATGIKIKTSYSLGK